MLAGAGLFLARERVFAVQSRVPALLDADRDYKHLVNGVDNLAIWLTGRTQRGSLSFYLVVILIVALVVPTFVSVWFTTPAPGNFIAFDSPAQLVIGVIIIIGAIGALQADRRFLAVLMVSVTGYGMAAVFALQGAPDLAVTQLLVETIVLVAFVLALRALPVEIWAKNPTGHRLGRALIGIGFGASMVYIAATAMASRIAEPISLAYPELAYVGGAGKNIVNVTLVDMRAWDTFGEITVLAAAATGVASLIFVRGRGDSRLRASAVATGSVDLGSEAIGSHGRSKAGLAVARNFASSPRDSWLVAGHTLAPERRSITFEVVTRLLFHTILLASLYLLLTGHNTPGGGFAGGLLAGLALTMRYLAGGRVELAESTPISPGTMMGVGLGLASLTAVAPLALRAADVHLRGLRVHAAALWHAQVRDLHDLRHRGVPGGHRAGHRRAALARLGNRRALRGPQPHRPARPSIRRRHGSGTMSTNVTLLIVMGVLFAVGIYLLLERSLTRVLLGIVLLGNGVNLLLLSTGGPPREGPALREGHRPGGVLGPAAAGADPHGDRHHLRGDGVHARHHLPFLGHLPGRRGRRRRRGLARLPAVALRLRGRLAGPRGHHRIRRGRIGLRIQRHTNTDPGEARA